jgi:hypothetical protein
VLAGSYSPIGTTIEVRGSDGAGAHEGGGSGAGGGGESGRCASWERVMSRGGDAHWGGALRRGDACR